MAQKIIGAARQRPEIASVYTGFAADTPGYSLDIDRDMVARQGVDISSLYTALQAYYGSYQINDFTIFGRNFKVVIQAAPEFRQTIDSDAHMYVRNSNNELVPISNFVRPKSIGSASILTRFNDYPAISIQGSPADGYSSGDAINAMKEIADATLTDGFAYEWSGMSRQEIKAGNQTVYVFALAILFVFLVLAALYESWKVPLPYFSVFQLVYLAPLYLLICSVRPTTFTSRLVCWLLLAWRLRMLSLSSNMRRCVSMNEGWILYRLLLKRQRFVSVQSL